MDANPEQLIAAAHASCFSMALSNDLSQHGHDVESVKTTVEVTVKMVDEVPTITKAAISTSRHFGPLRIASEAYFKPPRGRACPTSATQSGPET